LLQGHRIVGYLLRLRAHAMRCKDSDKIEEVKK
jgi:hypothetical protein